MKIFYQSPDVQNRGSLMISDTGVVKNGKKISLKDIKSWKAWFPDKHFNDYQSRIYEGSLIIYLRTIDPIYLVLGGLLGSSWYNNESLMFIESHIIRGDIDLYVKIQLKNYEEYVEKYKGISTESVDAFRSRIICKAKEDYRLYKEITQALDMMLASKI